MALRAFEATGRLGSVAAAARELGVTHGAVSRQVAQLEAWLGTSLFERHPARLVLREPGRALLADTTAVLDRLALATQQAREHAGPGALRVNAPPTFTMRWLIPRLSGFQRRHPGAEVRMTTGLAAVAFGVGGYDIAIRGAQAPLAGCLSVPFMTELILPVCHPDLCEQGPPPLERQTLLTYATEPVRWEEWLEAAGMAPPRPAATLGFEQMYFALQAAQEGLGLALVPAFLVMDDIAAGRLAAPFGTRGARRRRYFANAARSGPAVDAFIAWLEQEGRDTERMMEEWAATVPG
ncbi:LysR substrate-binding domain-containing protein [Roseococcus sp. DSY-14]|uniref:LysR substrate-binding domain-containing protein n=1 Tax=Roseococcus sp. DSY-14 TaxID=3369650 RepID=UPI00387B29D7